MWLQIRNGSGLNVKRKKEEKRSLRLQMCCDMNPSPFPWKERKRRKEVYVRRGVVNPSPFPWKEQKKRKEVYVCWGVVNPSPLCWDLASTITARQPIYTAHTILIIEQPLPFPQPILSSFALFAHLSLPWSNGWVALSLLFVRSFVRPAMVTSPLLLALDPQTHTFSESLW